MVGGVQHTSFLRLCTPSGTVSAKPATNYVKSTKQRSTSPSTLKSYPYLFNATYPVPTSPTCITMLSPIIRDVSPSRPPRISEPSPKPKTKPSQPKEKPQKQVYEEEDYEEEDDEEEKPQRQLQRRQPSRRPSPQQPAPRKKPVTKKPEPPKEPPEKPHKEHRSFLIGVHVLIALFVVDAVLPRLKNKNKESEILAKKHKIKQQRAVAQSHKQLNEKRELKALREERARFQQQFQEQNYLANAKARNAHRYVGHPEEHGQRYADPESRGRNGWDGDRDVADHQRRRHQPPRSPFGGRVE